MSSCQKTLNEQQLCEKLKCSELYGFADAVKGSLSTIGDNVDQCICFIRSFFKQVIKTQPDKSEGQLPHELLRSIEVCLQTLAKVFKGGDSSDLPNILYHIFYLLVKQECLPQALAAARIILTLTQSRSLHDSQMLVIISNTYMVLWNTALRPSEDNPETLQETRYELLLLAVQFFCFKDDFKAISEKVSYLASWCTSKLKNVQKLSLVYQTVLPLVHDALLRSLDQRRSSAPFVVDLILEECRLFSRLGQRVSPQAEWKKVASPSLFSEEKQLYNNISMLLGIVDRAYSLHHSAVTGSPCRAAKITDAVDWQTCQPGSEHFSCWLAAIAAVKTKLSELQYLIETQSQKQVSRKVVAGVLEFSPLIRAYLIHLHSVEVEGSQVATAFKVLRCLLFFHLYMVQEAKDDKQLVETLGRALDLCPDLLQKLVNDHIEHVKDVSSIASILYSLAFSSYQSKLIQFIIPLGKLSVNWTALHLKQCTNGGIETEKTFWKRCELLIWQFRQERLYEEALDLMAWILSLVPGLASHVVTRWVKVKKDIVNPALLKRNLQFELQQSGMSVLSNDDRFELLTAELNISMKEGLPAECCLAVLLELQQTTSRMDDPLKSCYVQTETTYFLSRFSHLELSLNNSFDESCQKAIGSAKELLETAGEDAPVAQLLLAANYFWLYMKDIDTLRNLAAKEVTEAAVDPLEVKCTDPILSQVLAEDKDYSCDVTLNYRHINVGHELASQGILDQAVALWSSALDGCTSGWSALLRDLAEGWFLEQVKVVAEVYASSFRVSEEIKAVTLWYNVVRDLKLGHEIVLAAASLSNSLLKVGMVKAASEVVQQNLSTLETLEDNLSKLRFMLSRSKVLYAKAQFSEGFRLLGEVLRHPLMQKNTKSCLLFMSEVKQLACRYSLLPAAISAAFREELSETPISLAQEALKMALAVMRHIGEEAIAESCDLHTVWILERAMLDSAALLGQLYISIGAAREAYSFLKEYLHKAQVVVSATRCARLILLIAHMDLMCEKLQDVKHKLTGVEFMLHPNNFSLPNPHSKEHPEDGESTEDPSEGKDGYRLNTVAKSSLSMAVRQFLARESRTSPQLSVPKLAEKHSPDCSCQLCQFLSTKQLWLERDLLKCLLYLTVGDASAAVDGFESLLAFLGALGKDLERETAVAASFLKGRLADSLCCTVDQSAGSWGELLLLRGTILLHLSEALQLRKSYAASLDRVDEALELFVRRRSGDRSFWKVFASLKHQKVKVLLSTLHQTAGRSGDPWPNSPWISNASDRAGSRETCRSPAASPLRQPQRDRVALEAPNAPKARKHSKMDRYLSSLNLEELQQVREKRRENGVFHVYDEDSENRGDKGGAKPATRRAPVRSAAAQGSRSSRKAPETARMPKRGVRARRQVAKTNLSTPAAEDAAPPAAGFSPELSLPIGPSAVLNVIEEEEAICAVARLSINELGPDDSGSLSFVQQDALFSEDQLPTCKPEVAPLEKLMQLLDEAFQLIIHFPPCPLYSEMCKTMLHLFDLQKCPGEQGGALFWYLTQTAAVTLQHVGLTCLHKKLKKQAAMVQQGLQRMLSGPDLSKADDLGFKLYSEFKPEELIKMLDLLPSEWTVVQLATADAVAKSTNGTLLTPDLLVCQYRKNKAPIMVHLSGSSDPQFHVSLFKQFKTILDESTATMKMTEPSLWWSVRRGLDKRLKELLKSIEEVWMGCWKGVFQGKIADATAYQALKSSVTTVLVKAAKYKLHCCNKRLLEAVLDSDLTTYQLSVAVCRLFGIAHSHPAHDSLVQLMQLRAVKDNPERHPVILILDKAIQALPWESVPILQKNPVSRVPSLAYLQAQLRYYSQTLDNVYVRGADTSKTYFILNPSNDIPKTQAQFENVFKGEGWPGVIGQPPQKEEFQAAIAGKDVILYCGHGSGREYLSGDLIEQMLCRACPILMGCGSGRLKVSGPKIEPWGVVLQYWLGGSPCVVANLWDVTDRDIDRFTEGLLTSWIPTLVTKTHIPDITKAVQAARKACKLQYLIGAAPVVYGLPVHSMGARQS